MADFAATVKVRFSPGAVLGVVEKRMPAVMSDLASEYADKVKMLMRDSPASGRVYRKGTKTEHQASAPGEPPAPDTGRLIQSITWFIDKIGDTWVAAVGSDVPYALYLEYGAAKGNRGKSGRLETVQWILYPRPAWGPALDEMRGEIPEMIAKWRGRG